MDKTLYEEIFDATRSIDLIVRNIEAALEHLKEMKKDNPDDWRIDTSIAELKEARARLGNNTF